MKTIGIDVGSSSIKVSLMDITSGEALSSVTLPEVEMPMCALQTGWAEQDPNMWWSYVCDAIKTIGREYPLSEVAAIGISYQMHGLVCLNANGEPLRKSIIWCDSRAVEIGEKALKEIGESECLARVLNSPGNFTASKLAWVKANEPELYAEIKYFLLPGDYIAYKLSGDIATTSSGLSEQILWDFKDDKRADFIAEYFGIELDKIPTDKPSIGIQALTDAKTEKFLGIKQGTPISYRAGDQPNNAFSLNVMESGEIAATGGTSGVVYGVTSLPKADEQSRVNTFLHVNHTSEKPSYGVLLCINGAGSLNAWARRTFAPELSYNEINDLCSQAPASSDGVNLFPFGNGAERMLGNKTTGAAINNVEFNRHTRAHILRATQESIAYAFRYGIDIMKQVGLEPKVIRAGKANLFLSPLFRETLATLCDVTIELYNTDGALGAARGAALGAGLFDSREQAFASLKKLETINSNSEIKQVLEEGYQKWKNQLLKNIY
ncbi:MAG: FGGY family carbohydrate kinase [Rikenellaceae bacterium]